MPINLEVLCKRIAIPLIIVLSILFYKFFPRDNKNSLSKEVAEKWIDFRPSHDIDLNLDVPE